MLTARFEPRMEFEIVTYWADGKNPPSPHSWSRISTTFPEEDHGICPEHRSQMQFRILNTFFTNRKNEYLRSIRSPLMSNKFRLLIRSHDRIMNE